MKYISPSKLFSDQLILIGEVKAKIVLNNFIEIEKILQYTLRYTNVKKLSMIIKVKNSRYSIEYRYDKTDKKLQAVKLRQ